KSGVALSATQANEPAFEVQIDQATGDLLVSGVPGLGDFEISLVTEDLAPEAGDDIVPSLEITEERVYLADKYNLVFSAEEFGELPLEVAFQGNQNETAQAIADALAADEQLSQHISAFVSGGNVTFQAKDQEFEFTVKLNDVDGLLDQHNAENNQTKLDTSIQAAPTIEVLESAAAGNPIEVLIEGFPEETTTYSFLGTDGSIKGSITVDFEVNQDGTATQIANTINADPNLNDLVNAVANGGTVTITGIDSTADFANVSWDVNGTTLTGDILSERVPPQFKTDQISAVSSVVQNKQVSLAFLPAQLDDQASTFSVTVAGQEIGLELPPSIDPLDNARFEALSNELNSINFDGTKTADGSASLAPAFSVFFDQPSLTYLIVGNQNTGDFEVSALGNDGLDILAQQEFLADKITISISNDETGNEIGSVDLPTLTDADVNAQAIVSAINQDQILNQSVFASVGADGEKVIIQSLDPSFSFTTDITVEDILNAFTVTQLQPADQIQTAFIQASAPQIARVEKNGIDPVGLVTSKVQSIDFKKGEDPMIFKQNDLFYFEGTNGETIHFVVTAPTAEIDPSDFNPEDAVWENHFKIFKPQLLNDDDPSIIIRKTFPSGHNLENGSLVELNIGLAEAVVKKGEITGFNIVNAGNGLPSSDALFAGGSQLLVESGAIKGYQESRSKHLEKFRTELNELVTTFVEQINTLYNPDDEPGSYIFGFDAVLTRPIAGKNLLMEEEYGLFGREGDAQITLYRDEVEMSLPHASKESFSIVNTTPIFPEEFDGQTLFFRGGDYAETFFRADDAGDSLSFYASASRMQNVTMENDEAYPGADLANGTEDDGRSLMVAYETIPFRLEGLEEGAKLPIIGDNFSFTALPSNPWNLATSLKVDQNLNSGSLLTSNSGVSGSNKIALSIAEMGDGNFIEKVSLLNANMGNTIAELNDNLEHQKSIETLLLDQRRAVSSVSIDEEVADLMRFQRSFQASSRVLNTLDKMLEIVVMGLIR
ncbi:MAG: flagellar basal body rod C-terminal domain-containing protein, partial [Opitutae bacterium]